MQHGLDRNVLPESIVAKELCGKLVDTDHVGYVISSNFSFTLNCTIIIMQSHFAHSAHSAHSVCKYTINSLDSDSFSYFSCRISLFYKNKVKLGSEH